MVSGHSLKLSSFEIYFMSQDISGTVYKNKSEKQVFVYIYIYIYIYMHVYSKTEEKYLKTIDR